jgi:hypothetical protein
MLDAHGQVSLARKHGFSADLTENLIAYHQART